MEKAGGKIWARLCLAGLGALVFGGWGLCLVLGGGRAEDGSAPGPGGPCERMSQQKSASWPWVSPTMTMRPVSSFTSTTLPTVLR